MLRIVFDVPKLEAKLKDLEQISSQPNFWDDQNKAKSLMRKLDDIKDQLSQFKEWNQYIFDANASLELYSLEPEEDFIIESYSGLQSLKENLDRWEFQSLLSGDYDKESAVITINAGAGGTDAQDWVEILFRMYTRWAEMHSMSIKINELSEGEEAGIKSVNFEIMVNMHMDIFKMKKEHIVWLGYHPLIQMVKDRPVSLVSKLCLN